MTCKAPMLFLVALGVSWSAPEVSRDDPVSPSCELWSAPGVLLDDPVPPSCDLCTAVEADTSELPDDTAFEGPDSNEIKDGICETENQDCYGKVGCRYWGTFKLVNNSSEDLWIEIPGGGRMKVEAQDSAEIEIEYEDAYTAPCKGAKDEGYSPYGKTITFKIYDKSTGGNEKGKVTFSCGACR